MELVDDALECLTSEGYGKKFISSSAEPAINESQKFFVHIFRNLRGFQRVYFHRMFDGF